MPSQLFIVSTPIGNLKDITFRAIETLQQVDIIYCEDTRHTRNLCNAYNIETQLKSYHEHNAQKQRPIIIEELKSGKSIALVSDAGTPLISDPGYKLVESCIENNITITPIPGPSALLSALVISGLPTDQFYFAGFMPTKSGERIELLKSNQYLPFTQIYYETPNRLLASLKDIHDVMGTRAICVGRELTKTFEEAKRGTAQEIYNYYTQGGTLKGEIVLLIAGYGGVDNSISIEVEEVLRLLVQHWPTKKVTSVMANLTKLSKTTLYEKAIELKNE